MTPAEVSLSMLKTPFHPRTEAANRLNHWTGWKGYTEPAEYFDTALEYFAIRNATGVYDLSPMIKYRISGPDATEYLDRVMTRDVTKLKPGRVAYNIWCNDAGKVLDDGTLFHLQDGDYRLCAYDYHLDWLTSAAIGFNVQITDETADVAALAVQGPTSCAVLRDMGLSTIDTLKPFGIAYFDFAGTRLMVSRTGFTGDLGYELWIAPEHALVLWDRLFDAGRLRGIAPFGSDALKIARIEAGFVQAGVDFLGANQCVRPGRARSPYELGLGWLVDLQKANFNGRRALAKEKTDGSKWQLVKLDIEGNKPAHNSYIYAGRSRQVGFVTSAVWSPIAKKNIAIATVEAPYGNPGTALKSEIYYQRELHWSRVMAACEIVEEPFWNPDRRRATPPADY